MPKPIPIGVRGVAEETVEFRHTLAARHELLPPVYSTSDMVRLMEFAAFHALHPYSEEGELNLGTQINIEHRAPSGIGARIKAEAVLEATEGRFYRMRVSARDQDGVEIGRGTVGRAFIRLDAFLQKMKARGVSAAGHPEAEISRLVAGGRGESGG